MLLTDVPIRLPPSRGSILAKDCPTCGLINPSEAQRCDCGYDFETRRMQRSYLRPKQAARTVAIGAVGIGTVFVALALMRKIIWVVAEFTK